MLTGIPASTRGYDTVNRKLVSALSLLSILLVCSVVTVPTSAADYSKIGVKAGDFSKYSATGPGVLNGSYATFLVINTTGTLVWINFTQFNPGGTINSTSEFDANITTGSGFFIAYLLICPGLVAGDHIYNSSSWFTINSTFQMSVIGYTRTVNLVNLTMGSQYLRWWWDQSTGLMVRLLADVGSGPVEFALMSTSAFGIFSDLVVMLLIGGGIAAVVLIAAAVIIHHRRKK